DGISILSRIKEINENTSVIIVTAFGDIPTAVEAMKKGAYDFITKPFDVNQLKISVNHSLEKRELKIENLILKSQNQKNHFVTRDPHMLQLLKHIELIALSDVNVLIYGETGTGKELIARLIHEKSHRSKGPFIAVNCGSIPPSLFESEIFGHEKNAFTGATEKKPGLLELADQGSFFLDEIGELPLEVQSKLLRFLEEKRIRRVGGLKTFPVDVRIIAATNRDLKKEVENNKFRSDLYYRLNVAEIFIPPLRERKSDIPLLVNYYIDLFNKQFKKNIKGVSPEAMEYLKNYSWPGNVRELKNVLERIFVLIQDDWITEKDLPSDLVQGKTFITNSSKHFSEDSKFLPLEEIEKQHISKALILSKGNITKAAELLRISRFALYRRIEKYGLKIEELTK
ncbi:MAG: sigma-54-dependent transcriptional regulator, partial [Caldanaerobacter sp.]